MITENLHKIKLELFSNEIELIIEELEKAPHNIYIFLDYDRLVNKLKEKLK